MADHQVTAIFSDLVTGTPLGALPLSAAQFSSVLNGYGALSATLNLADSRVQKQLAFLGGAQGGLLQPGRTAIYIDMDGTLVWGGIYLTHSYDDPTKQLTIGGNEFWFWMSQQRIISWDASFTATDQLTIATTLLTTALGLAGSIPMTVPTVLSGQLVDASFDANDVLPIGQALQTLAQQSGVLGFDYMVDVAYNTSGVPTKTINLSYPRRGRVAGTTGLVFDVGAGKQDAGYNWQADATAQAVTAYGIGAGVGPVDPTGNNTPLRSVQSTPSLIDGGWPLTEQSLSRTDVTDQTTLDELTSAFQEAYALPVQTPVVTMKLDGSNPPFGAWLVGDDARLIIPADSFFPDGHDQYWRIVAHQVQMADSGVSSVAVTFNAPPETF